MLAALLTNLKRKADPVIRSAASGTRLLKQICFRPQLTQGPPGISATTAIVAPITLRPALIGPDALMAAKTTSFDEMGLLLSALED